MEQCSDHKNHLTAHAQINSSIGIIKMNSLAKRNYAKMLADPENKGSRQNHERIVKSGGHITHDNLGRCLVNNKLAMSRSIGDYDLKPFGVTAVPDTKEIKIKHGKDAFLILTTDGINYVMNDNEIINAVNCCRTAKEAAQYVSDQALLYSSEDNASALIIPFGAWGKFSSLSNNIKFAFGRQLGMSSRH
ncbi:hypothetical protein RND71_043950 [Anisodus tanguticus]|uniref:PPM-type phosphatase domain-containing protein n=1 Tax=Anisodus tanguticus TaxID=243964 RepID=A0AAE1UQV9_9SOLA|nr:hypothetical protein RND71_043950 [Anisodus tanguticus]